MRSKHVFAICALLALSFLLSYVSVAAPPETAAKIDKAITLGEHWYGPELTMEDLKGRVVLYEFWGIN